MSPKPRAPERRTNRPLREALDDLLALDARARAAAQAQIGRLAN